MTDWADNFNEWRFDLYWLGDPTGSRQVSVEDLYQAFKARMENEARQREALRIAIQEVPPVTSDNGGESRG